MLQQQTRHLDRNSAKFSKAATGLADIVRRVAPNASDKAFGTMLCRKNLRVLNSRAESICLSAEFHAASAI